MTLDHSSLPFISLRATIEYLYRYLEMEQIRNSNFIYQIHVDDKLEQEDIFLPPILIQPFIENAIWHNALPHDNKMELDIRFLGDHNQLTCIIEDNGIGIDASLRNKEKHSNHQSVGIENIRQRIKVLNEKYNLQSSVSIEDKSRLEIHKGSGTIVTINIKNSDR
jgi:LytS/YehU family sensor histidine kinase